MPCTSLTSGAHIACALLLLLPACGPRNVANENDTLRERIIALESELAASHNRASALQTELMAARYANANGGATVAATPDDAISAVSAITIERLTHLADTNNDGLADTARVYVQSQDGRGRFTQVHGTLDLVVARLDPAGGTVIYANQSYSAADVADAYRSSFAGTHYTFELTLEPPLAAGVSLNARVRFTDTASERAFEADRAIMFEVPTTD